MAYDFKQSEEAMLSFWKEQRIYEKVKERLRGKQPFYFLDGPPYTSGKVHLGTAWNKSLKDMVLRYKRMRGYDVWDRAGYDMHGLPTENATMKELGLASKEEIATFGVEKFLDACKALCLKNMKLMNEVFGRLGVWMDFENAYQSVTKEFMEAEWWLIKQAHEQGRLYEGLRTMTWCPRSESALAKHELEYKTVTDTSIFVKFKIVEKRRSGNQKPENEYLVIWTTTPWTIPFNLAVMVNPDVEYVKAKLTWNGKEEYWYVAAPLAGVFFGSVVNAPYEVVETLKGSELEGWRYEHPFQSELATHYEAIRENSQKLHTVLLSSEYVDTSGGSGLVHCAPGCGPEDYEVGHANGLPAFNTIDPTGRFPESMGRFAGLVAKEDDKQFIAALDEAGALIATTEVEHEYPHDWRYHKPVIFRTTKQWFFKVEDLKEELVKQNDKIAWVPQAAYNAFDSWLKNLRDNSISKQRYWGTPLPIWRNTAPDADPDDYLVIGSARELKELAGLDEEPSDLHLPVVDAITITKDGKSYKRVPDVLDVWVDAGTVSWNCLDYPHQRETFDKLFPAEFILEGKDQIRGWFNLLHIASNLAFGKPCFRNVYMHGFINDAQGRKMSKSQGNYILPDEVIEKYGANTLRYYLIGAANPGLDLNYNFDDVALKHRNLAIFWNLQTLITGLEKQGVTLAKPARLDAEERYILSRLHTTIKAVTERMERYALNEVPALVERLLLDLSRNYVQLVREKLNSGSDEERERVLHTLFTVYTEGMKLFAIVAPMFAEHVYQELKRSFPLAEESIHLEAWPEHDPTLIDDELEQEFALLFDAISATLAARDTARVGVRWPLARAIIEAAPEDAARLRRLEQLFTQQVNVKAVEYREFTEAPVTLAPNYKALGKSFGHATADVAKLISEATAAHARSLKSGDAVTLGGHEVKPEHVTLSRSVPDGWALGEGSKVTIFLDVRPTPELEAEGFAREVVRRVQQLRKEAGLQKRDAIELWFDAPELEQVLSQYGAEVRERVGAKSLSIGELPQADATEGVVTHDVKIKGKCVRMALRPV